MRIFRAPFKNPSCREEVVWNQALIKKAEANVDILENDLRSKNWTEIWETLCHSELADANLVGCMSTELREKFRQVIVELKQVFQSEKRYLRNRFCPDKGLVGPIEEALSKL